MKVSYLCANSYADPMVLNQASFPYPPGLYDPAVGATSVEGALANARLADELGFDWVSVSEHHYAPGIMSPNALVWAGALTQVVKRAKIALLGPIVSVNNPVRLAEEIALLDMMSGGRVVVFMLRGTPNEFNTYYVNAHETRERAQEAIKLIERALTEPQPFGWEGRYFRYPTVAVWPRPTQTPFPPIFSSGNSPESCVFAAQNHHGLAMSFIPPRLAAEAVQLYKSECEKAGWRPTADQIIYRSFIAIGENEDEVQTQQQVRAARPRPRREYQEAPRGLGPLSWLERAGGSVEETVNGTARRYDPNEDGAARAGEGFGLGSLQFEGIPDIIVERMRTFHELTGAGVLDLIFSNVGGPDATARRLRLFATDVLPHIRDIGSADSTQEPPVETPVGASAQA
jgi:alkanesulfonate monooxygenase SsuD/methylene tetrahydromethanopterin reductase-like flavin-dependent oxidoreductase (luciferase family)